MCQVNIGEFFRPLPASFFLCRCFMENRLTARKPHLFQKPKEAVSLKSESAQQICEFNLWISYLS